MWAVSRSASAGGMPNFVSRRALPWAAAIALHVLLAVFAGYLIAPPIDFVKQEPPRDEPFAFVRLPPPPPKIDAALADIAIAIMPRFRPRVVRPVGVPLQMTTERGSAAEAIFRYWCANRPDTIEATGRLCPSDVVMNGLAALPERGLLGDPDAGSLFGAGDQGYTIDEAAARRGWVKPKPRIGQDAQKAKTDKVTGPHSDDVYGGYPWDATPRGR
jgi:hypothetical protein